MATQKKPKDSDDAHGGAQPDDPKAAFKAALERKQAQGSTGRAGGGTGPGKPSAGSTKAAGGRRTFQRKSGSA